MKQKSAVVLIVLLVVAIALGYIGYYGIGKTTLTTAEKTNQGIIDGGGVFIEYKTGYENPSESDINFAVEAIKEHIDELGQSMQFGEVTVEKAGDNTIKATISKIVDAKNYGDSFLQVVNQALGEDNTFAFEVSESSFDKDGNLTLIFKSGKEGITTAELGNASTTVKKSLDDQGVTSAAITVEGTDSLKMSYPGFFDAETVVTMYGLNEFEIGEKNKLGINNIKQGLDLSGGVYIVYEAKKEDGSEPTGDEMDSAVSMIQKRLDRKGWSETEVSKEGQKRIRVEIPGVEDAATAVEEIGQTAKLYFTDENGNTLVDGADVVDAKKMTHQESQGGPTSIVVSLEFNEKGKQAFAEATANNIGKVINIVLDGRTISAPTVNAAITDGNAIITGNFTVEEAEELAALIRAGSLPFDLEPLEMNSVGARLGDNSLKTSIYGGMVGIGLVMLFMLLYYRLAGLAADWALAIYICLDLIVMSLFNVTLTLPGIAGIILSVGMAVDANVIIFERIKEELAAGKTFRLSIQNGFSKALSAILDGNITTLIACCVLYWYGTGPIRGFAETLMMGIIISMFTAIVITRLIMKGFSGIGLTSLSLYGVKKREEGEKKKVIEFVKYRKIYFIISALLILVGLGTMVANKSMGKGAFNYDTQFTGGTSIEATIGKDFENSDIQAIITENTAVTTPQIQKVGDNGTNVVIKTSSLSEEERAKVIDALCEKYEIEKQNISITEVSGTISGEMQRNSFVSTAIACVAMLIYISIRFRDLKTGGSAILALVHDALIVIGSYALLRISLNTSFIAAILTILGYSINATIVIFDRIREGRKRFARNETDKLVNTSVTQTMTRSIFTSLTTLFTVIALYIFGVDSVREFVLPIIIGIVCGTYSSICLAGSMWYLFSNVKDKKK